MVEELELTTNQVVWLSKICGGWEENIHLLKIFLKETFIKPHTLS